MVATTSNQCRSLRSGYRIIAATSWLLEGSLQLLFLPFSERTRRESKYSTDSLDSCDLHSSIHLLVLAIAFIVSVVANSLYRLRFLAEFELKRIFHPPSPVPKFVRKFGAVVPDTGTFFAGIPIRQSRVSSDWLYYSLLQKRVLLKQWGVYNPRHRGQRGGSAVTSGRAFSSTLSSKTDRSYCVDINRFL
eukprot:scpid31319/ scgid33661/ 